MLAVLPGGWHISHHPSTSQLVVSLLAPQQMGNLSGVVLGDWSQTGSCSASATHQKASEGHLHMLL